MVAAVQPIFGQGISCYKKFDADIYEKNQRKMFLCFYFIDKNIDTIPPLTLTMLYEADQDDSGGSRKGKPG